MLPFSFRRIVNALNTRRSGGSAGPCSHFPAAMVSEVPATQPRHTPNGGGDGHPYRVTSLRAWQAPFCAGALRRDSTHSRLP